MTGLLKRVGLILAIAALACGTALATGQEEQHPEVFRFGFLSSMSGTFAGVAETQRKSFEFAAEEINARGGLNMPWGKVKVETIVKDDEVKLDVGVRRFREMTESGIVALTGGIWNPMSAALNEECKINPIIYVPGYVPAMDVFQKGNPSDCTFTPTFTPWSIGYITGKSAIVTLGKKKIYLLERADSWGQTIRQGLEAACARYGGEIVGVSQVSVGTSDYSPVLNAVLQAQPEVFVTTMFGGDAIANLKQAYDMGLYDKMIIFNNWTANVVAKGIPAPALENLYALSWFYWDLEGFKDAEVAARVKAYSDAFTKRWNEPPDNMGTAAYVAAQMIFQAVEKAKSFDPVEVSKVLDGGEFETVNGRVKFREDHQPVSPHTCYLLRGKAPAERQGAWDFFEVLDSFGGEEVLPPLSEMGY